MASTSPPHVLKFSAAIRAVFGEWTALRLAVENEWAGSQTRERALSLLQRVHDGLLSSATVHRDEVEDLLEQSLVDDFNVEAEDESPNQVAHVLCQLHAEAKAGGSATADLLLQRTAGTATWVDVAPPPRVHGESSDDDDDEGEEGEDEDGGSGGRGGPAPMDAEEGSGRRPEPQVDEDGFTMVQTRSRTRGGRR